MYIWTICNLLDLKSVYVITFLSIQTLFPYFNYANQLKHFEATKSFLSFCFAGFVVTMFLPLQITVFIWIMFYLRHTS